MREEEEVEVVPSFLPLPPSDLREVGSLKVGGASYEPVAGWGHPHDSVWTSAYPHTLQGDCAFEVKHETNGTINEHRNSLLPK